MEFLQITEKKPEDGDFGDAKAIITGSSFVALATRGLASAKTSPRWTNEFGISQFGASSKESCDRSGVMRYDKNDKMHVEGIILVYPS